MSVNSVIGANLQATQTKETKQTKAKTKSKKALITGTVLLGAAACAGIIYGVKTGKFSKMSDKIRGAMRKASVDVDFDSKIVKDGKKLYNGTKYVPAGEATYIDGKMSSLKFKDGKIKHFYSDGTLAGLELPSGVKKQWHSNGVLNLEEYADGVKRSYNDQGVLRWEKDINGVIKEYDSEGYLQHLSDNKNKKSIWFAKDGTEY